MRGWNRFTILTHNLKSEKKKKKKNFKSPPHFQEVPDLYYQRIEEVINMTIWDANWPLFEKSGK